MNKIMRPCMPWKQNTDGKKKSKSDTEKEGREMRNERMNSTG